MGNANTQHDKNSQTQQQQSPPNTRHGVINPDPSRQPGKSRIESPRDDLANSDQKNSQGTDPSPSQEQPRRYDESDPVWTEPDVQMGNENSNPNKSDSLM